MGQLRTLFGGFDPVLFFSVLGLTAMGLVTMYSHVGDNSFFNQQIIWIILSSLALFLAMVPDYRFLRSGNIAFLLFVATVCLLILVLFILLILS